MLQVEETEVGFYRTVQFCQERSAPHGGHNRDCSAALVATSVSLRFLYIPVQKDEVLLPREDIC